MMKVKLFRQMVLIMTLSVACVTNTGCSYARNHEQTESRVNEQPEENGTIGTDFSVEEPKNSETDKPSNSPVPKYNSAERKEEVIPYGEYKTITGYDLTHTEPTEVTLKIKSVKRGADAYEALLKNNATLSAPKKGMEYIIITVSYSYNKGPWEKLTLEETHGTDPLGKHFFFLAYATDMTEYVQDCIYDKTIKQGDTVDGNVAFLTSVDNTWPLAFFGYGEKIGFAMNP